MWHHEELNLTFNTIGEANKHFNTGIADPADFGLKRVQIAEMPNDDTSFYVLGPVQIVGGEPMAEWVVERPLTPEEVQTRRDRKIRRVKAEANRRIVALCPEWKQRNLTAQAAQLAKKGEANWTTAEADAWAAGEALWLQIAAIRAASDTIEAMDPLPVDVTDDTLWP